MLHMCNEWLGKVRWGLSNSWTKSLGRATHGREKVGGVQLVSKEFMVEEIGLSNSLVEGLSSINHGEARQQR